MFLHLLNVRRDRIDPLLTRCVIWNARTAPANASSTSKRMLVLRAAAAQIHTELPLRRVFDSGQARTGRTRSNRHRNRKRARRVLATATRRPQRAEEPDQKMRFLPCKLIGMLTLLLAGVMAWRPLIAPAEAAQPVPDASILVYHRFADEATDSMTVRVSTLEAHLAWLRAHGYQIVPLRDIVAWLEDPSATLPPRAIAITIDDGHRSVYEVMRPIVLRERFPVTLFIYPSAISNASYAMTWPQLRELRDTGLFDVQSHTWWHPNFNTERRRLSEPAFEQFALTQFTHSRELLERQLGGHVNMLAWPFGIHNDDLVALAQHAGYRAAFTIEPHNVTRSTQPLAIPRFLMVDTCTPECLGQLLGERPSPLDARTLP
ncbi:polysaccharide deacetylase family protein [Paraburkholderia sp. A2WS-5]|uniref:polysaccharide deacetylase family protein n=1 Tax=unclassified Paraburkholderia TaxID=2615204 RepID=UPI003B8071E8